MLVAISFDANTYWIIKLLHILIQLSSYYIFSIIAPQGDEVFTTIQKYGKK